MCWDHVRDVWFGVSWVLVLHLPRASLRDVADTTYSQRFIRDGHAAESTGKLSSLPGLNIWMMADRLPPP